VRDKRKDRPGTADKQLPTRFLSRAQLSEWTRRLAIGAASHFSVIARSLEAPPSCPFPSASQFCRTSDGCNVHTPISSFSILHQCKYNRACFLVADHEKGLLHVEHISGISQISFTFPRCRGVTSNESAAANSRPLGRHTVAVLICYASHQEVQS
jgi:hypothetical protein